MAELEGCELGTQDYWDEAYQTEIKNFKEHGDPGEIWFGEDSMLRVIRWILKSSTIKPDDPIIDLGCGNGMTLLELGREGFTNLTGVDYSQPAIELASNICREELPDIKYHKFDIITDSVDPYKHKFRIAHDKGTYDAISLNPEDPKTKRLVYIDKVYDMLTEDGMLIITSCNWTESELVEHFKEKFKLKETIPTPQFKFGGSVGQVVTALIFVKNN